MEGIRNTRRMSTKKESRLALLSKIREAKEKGERLRIESGENAIYDTVDEAEYAKIVQQRLEDDWIVDDDATGYADDGREIFDDRDEDEEAGLANRSSAKRSAKSQSASKKARLNPDIRKSETAPLRPSAGRDIRNLFASAASSRKRTEPGMAAGRQPNDNGDDDNLSDLLAELESSSASVTTNSSSPAVPPQSSLRRMAAPLVKPLRENSLVALRPVGSRTEQSRAAPASTAAPVMAAVERRSPTGRPFRVKQKQTNPFAASPVASTCPGRRQPAHHQSPLVAEQTPLPDLDHEFDDDLPEVPGDGDDHYEDVDVQPMTSSPAPTKSKSTTVMESQAGISTSVQSATWLAAELEAAAAEAEQDQKRGTPEQEEEEEAEAVRLLSACESAGQLSTDSYCLRFFWIDAYEDARQQPGVVYLFGKTADPTRSQRFCSACLKIQSLERRIFILPRQSLVTDETESQDLMKMVYTEFRSVCLAHKINKFRCKMSTKRYAFQLTDVPSEATYLEVRYAASQPALPSDLHGEYFSHVFGTNTSFLENLILDLQLRGPCWLEVKNAARVEPQFSWCQQDFLVSWQSGSGLFPVAKLASVLAKQREEELDKEEGKQMTMTSARSRLLLPPPPPPLCLVAVNLKSVAQASHSEIISVGLLVDQHYAFDRPVDKSGFQSHYLILAPPKDAALPYDLRTRLPTFGRQYAPPPQSSDQQQHSGSVKKGASAPGGGVDVEPNERALLGRLLIRLHKLDPDIIVGHDLWGHQIELLIQRLQANRVAHWHRVGRLRRAVSFSIASGSRSWLVRHALPGRLVCDTRVSATELVRSRTYNLSELVQQVLSTKSTQQQQQAKPPRRQVPVAVLRQLLNETDIKRLGGPGSLLDAIGSELTDLEIDSADLRCQFTSSELVRQLIDFCLTDAHLVLQLAHQLQVLPLAAQITSICGNTLSRTLSGGRAERNEALLLHAFTEHGYLVPDPPVVASKRHGAGAGGSHGDEEADWNEAGAIPDESRKRKPAYTGGLVLEPKRGFYDKYILLLDFNSLYPSIIQEFNICFTTVDRDLACSLADGSQRNEQEQTTTTSSVDQLVTALLSPGGGHQQQQQHIGGGRLPTEQPEGLLPVEIRRLVESRREVKKLIANAGGDSRASAQQVAQWNTRQAALKLTANSVYGCLGFRSSRFCAKGLAALVTGLGRGVLMNTRELVENLNFEVIYGDTDSIMVNTNTSDLKSALAIGDKVRQEVNKHYRLLELDTDGVYASMLLLAKKKYAALSVVNPLVQCRQLAAESAAAVAPVTKQELKGLDIVRRDWSNLAVNVGRTCVTILLSGESREAILERIHSFLSETAQRIREGQLPVSDFVITKMLTKAPEDYADSKSLPHVQVALRFNSGDNQQGDATGLQSSVVPTSAGSTKRRFRAGDAVQYIICKDGSNQVATQRAYSPAELSHSGTRGKDGTELSVDIQYYLANQIHPVVSRLLAPIEGTSPAHIADALGLDPTGYRRSMAAGAAGDEDDNVCEERTAGSESAGYATPKAWVGVDHLSVECPRRCGGPPIELRSSVFSALSWKCPSCSHLLTESVESMNLVANRIVLVTRRCIQRYELGWLRCEDPVCGLTTRQLFCPPNALYHHGAAGDLGRLWARGGRPLCPGCGGQAGLKAIYTEASLYRQLCFFRHLVSPPPASGASAGGGHQSAVAVVVVHPVVNQLLDRCRSHLHRLLSHSAFANVNLGDLLSDLLLPGQRAHGTATTAVVC